MGVYSINYSFLDVWIMLFVGILVYLFRKAIFPLTPLILGLVLAETLETNLRRSLLISDGNFSILFESTISIILALLSFF